MGDFWCSMPDFDVWAGTAPIVIQGFLSGRVTHTYVMSAVKVSHSLRAEARRRLKAAILPRTKAKLVALLMESGGE